VDKHTSALDVASREVPAVWLRVNGCPSWEPPVRGDTMQAKSPRRVYQGCGLRQASLLGRFALDPKNRDWAFN